jgi:carbon monoxide dehydrogenase subunit G
MKIEKEFVVGRGSGDVAMILNQDETFAQLFPDTHVERIGPNERETRTRYPGLDRNRDIRFVFRTLPTGELHFEKVCDGNVWRSLEGQVRIEIVDENMTRIVLSMEGRTRAYVPEMTIRMPMREQIDQMAKTLRAALENS